MIVYVEAVILDNFCFDFLLGYLTYLFCRRKVRWLPILLSALSGTSFALTFPLIRSLGLLVKIPMLFCCTVLLTLKKSLKEFFLNTFVYSILTFTLSGIITFFLGGDLSGGFIGLKWGGVVASTSAGIFLLLYSVRQISGLLRERRRKERFATAELINGGNHITINALFDSGNLLTDENGEGVVVTDERYLENLGELVPTGEMCVHTASGSKTLKLVKIPEIRIYSEGVENILFNVTAALSELPKEYALILPCD